MRTVQQIYSDYKIMPNLQLHQLRVAAVAKTIIDNFQEPLNEKGIILACLFHDMGNIIKSDLNYFPEFLEPEGLEYWQNVKNKYIDKYGHEEHIATEKIAKEINLSFNVLACIKKIGFSNAKINEIDDSFENKICNYSDMRVGPYGVLPMEERIHEGHKRYEGRKHAIYSDSFDSLVESLRNIEKQIFNKTNIKPSEISNDVIDSIIKELRVMAID
jgi:hypothetical protein